ncbi:MAG: hypothetical protein Q8942_20200 [Bacillota bacterium]|nr:hypothetical protein [Bacillota bacterium]
MKLVRFNKSEATKNGNKEGKTILMHRFIPFNADSTAVFENKIRQTIKVIHISGIKFFFK